MATSYNPRSGSSDSRSNKTPQAQNRSVKARRGQLDKQLKRPAPSVDRSTVSYAQSAKSDLAAQAPASDPRNRYARFRTEQPVRVLGDPSESRAKGRHQINEPPPGGQGGAPRRAGSGGSGRAGGGGGARNGAGVRDATGRRGRRDEYGAPLTVREHRERERQFRKQQGKAPRRVLFAIITLIVLAAVGFLVYQSPAFSITAIQVEGVKRLTGERLTARAAIPADSTLLRLDTAGISKSLEDDPWIASAEIRRSFPSTITLVVREREIAAVVEVPGPSPNSPLTYWLVSYDGFWLGSLATQATAGDGAEGGEGASGEGTSGDGAEADGGATGAGATGAGATGDADGTAGAEGDATGATDGTASATDAAAQAASDAAGTQASASASSVLEGVHVAAAELAGLSRVIDVSRNANPILGETVTDVGVLNALNIINGFTPETRALVRSISAPDRVRTNLTLTNNVVVAFGAADDVEAKEKVILKLLADYEGRLSYINVRVPDHATVRAT